MTAPSFSICEHGSTPSSATDYDVGNPIPFLNVDKGIPSDILTVDIWNDRTNLLGVSTAVAPRVYAVSSDDISAIFAGTAANGFVSMLEARSCLGLGTPADLDTEWTPISTIALMFMGDMPAGSMRTVELRLNPPVDAPTTTLKNFFIVVSA